MNAASAVIATMALTGGMVAIAAGAAIGPVQSASAAPGDSVEVSSDGITYGTTFSGSIFGATRLIPGSNESATLWVRNPTSADAFLRIVITDVVADDAAYRSALSLRMTLPDRAANAPLPAPGNCTVLATGVPMDAGEALPVDLTVELGNLTGTQGQNAHANFTVGVTLSEVAYPAGDCSTSAVSVPATPGTPVGTGTGAGTGSTPETTGTSVDSPTLSQPGARGINKPHRGFFIDFNTGRVDLGFMFLLLGAGIILGVGWFVSLAKRRGDATISVSPPALGGTP